jgi:ATP-dependent protease ClpP protease subunit
MQSKRRHEDDEDPMFGKEKGFPVVQWDGPDDTKGWSIFLYGPIVSAEQMTEAVMAFSSANKGDTVVVHLSTGGGCVDATDTFIDAMKDCAGRVVVKASGGVHSAGTLILLNAPEFSLSAGFNSLFHNGSVGSGGKLSDWRRSTAFTSSFMEKLFAETYAGFFTEEELERLIDGKDFWMDAEEFLRRHKQQQEYFEKLQEASEEDVTEK